MKPGNHISCFRECRRVWRNEPSHSQVSSHFENWSPNRLLNFQKAISRAKIHWIKEFFYHWKFLGMKMFKMGSHDLFWYLKHKLWPKEGLGVKLSIWFPTTKNREFPWFTCMKVACHILLERYRWGLQLCFKHHLNQRSAQKVMGLQSYGNPNFENFRISNLGVPGQNDIWV